MNDLPQLIVFDLDYTLWPFWVDTHVQPPFLLDQNSTAANSYERVIDSNGSPVRCFSEVPLILDYVQQLGIKMAIASRTSCTDEANAIVNLFGWDSYFAYRQIFPGDKQTHFKNIRTQSGIPFNKMLFFDDEQRNIISVSSIGVPCVLVRGNMTMDLVKNGLQTYSQKSLGK